MKFSLFKTAGLTFLFNILFAACILCDDDAWFTAGPVLKITGGPKQHFFGYYGISPWDSGGRYVMSLETSFHDRMPGADDTAVIGLVDLHDNNKFIPVAETRAWNFQQGAMQRWLPGAGDSEIIYNDRRDGSLVSIVRNVWTGEERVLPLPISDLSDDGVHALSINFARLSRLRPVVGYPGLTDLTDGIAQPEEDGVLGMDLDTGKTRLLVSLAQAARAYSGPVDLSGKTLWIDHTLFNPSGTRFLFLLRYEIGIRNFDTALLTADARNGGDIRLVMDFGRRVSHFAWLYDDSLLVTLDTTGSGRVSGYVVVQDAIDTTPVPFLPDNLTVDGHPALSPDHRLIVTDTYPDQKQKQSLILIDPAAGRTSLLGRFKHPVRFLDAIRCDLHPRWNRAGTAISFDSINDGTRQVYILEIKTASSAPQ